ALWHTRRRHENPRRRRRTEPTQRSRPSHHRRHASLHRYRPVRHRSDMNAEQLRLAEDARREKNWKRWGPYLSERQWGTVREDYSEGGTCWEYLPHDHARSRAYRWGEDGLLGITDRE